MGIDKMEHVAQRSAEVLTPGIITDSAGGFYSYSNTELMQPFQ